MKKFWLYALVFIGVFIGAQWQSPAAAQQDDTDIAAGEAGQPNELGIALSARVGFDGFYKSRSWLPVTVLVSNDGVPIEGDLIIKGVNDNTVYSIPIDLPTQSRKRIRLNSFTGREVGNFRVELFNGSGELVATATENAIPLPASDSLLYGVVSSQPDALELLEKVTGARAETGVAFIDLVELPENPALWQPLDILIFNDVDTNQLSAAQREALDTWLRQGGQLVITGGTSWQKTVGPFGDLLPVEVTGSRSVTDLPAFGDQIGEPFRDAGPYVVAESRLVDGRALLNEAGLPLLARRSVGRGATYFLALDPRFAPLNDWDGSLAVWDEIADRTPRPTFWETGFIVETDAANAVSGLPSLTLPSVFLLVGFVLLYIVVIGPANYLYLKRNNRGERAWLTIPAIIAFFTLTAYLLGLQFKGNTVLINQMSIVTGRVGAETGRVDVGVGIYSPRRGSYDIVFEEDVLARPLNANSFNSDELEVILGNEVRLSNTLIDVGEVGTFGARAVRPLPDIQAEVSFDLETTSDLVVTVTNRGDKTLENAGIYGGSSFVSLGDIRPGETVSKNISSILTPEAIENIEQGLFTYDTYAEYDSASGSSYQNSPFETDYYAILGTTSYYGDSVYYPRYELLESLFDHYGQETVFDSPQRLTLMGWIEENQLDIKLESGRFEASGVSLYFLEIPLFR